MALEFCVQTEGGVTVGDVNGYRVCDEFGREAGLFWFWSGSRKYIMLWERSATKAEMCCAPNEAMSRKVAWILFCDDGIEEAGSSFPEWVLLWN